MPIPCPTSAPSATQRWVAARKSVSATLVSQTQTTAFHRSTQLHRAMHTVDHSSRLQHPNGQTSTHTQRRHIGALIRRPHTRMLCLSSLATSKGAAPREIHSAVDVSATTTLHALMSAGRRHYHILATHTLHITASMNGAHLLRIYLLALRPPPSHITKAHDQSPALQGAATCFHGNISYHPRNPQLSSS